MIDRIATAHRTSNRIRVENAAHDHLLTRLKPLRRYNIKDYRFMPGSAQRVGSMATKKPASSGEDDLDLQTALTHRLCSTQINLTYPDSASHSFAGRVSFAICYAN